MITIPIEDWVFVLCLLVGGGLLLVTVLLDDILGGILEAFHIGFDIGGVSLMPLALSFISMFGVGGLFATQVLDLHTGQAAIVGAVFGAFGFGLAWALFGLLRTSEGEPPFSTESLVGRSASVVVAIPAGKLGSVIVRAQGRTHEYSATSPADVPAGQVVTITGVAGSALIVAAQEAASTPAAPAGEGGNPDA